MTTYSVADRVDYDPIFSCTGRNTEITKLDEIRYKLHHAYRRNKAELLGYCTLNSDY